MEEELDPARHCDAPAERGSEAPVTGRLERRAVERGRDPSNQRHAGDVAFDVDLDVHSDVATRTAAGGRCWVDWLLLLEHGRRFYGRDRRSRVLSARDSRRADEHAQSGYVARAMGDLASKQERTQTRDLDNETSSDEPGWTGQATAMPRRA